MDNRKLLANAKATPPTAPASPSIGYPGNGGVSDPPGTPGAHWFYQLGEELRNVITAGGLTPSDTDLGQVLAALVAGFGLPKLHAVVGYQKLPGGLILQWGSGNTSASPGVDTVHTFPIAFASQCYVVVTNVGINTASGGVTNPVVIGTFNFTVNNFTADNSSTNATATSFYYLAIGK